MFKVSDIISKPIYSIYEGINIGTVNDFVISSNHKKILGFTFLDDESEINNSFVPVNKIYGFGINCLTVKNNNFSSYINFDNLEKIINKEAISISGESLGKIIDVYFDEKFLISSFETSQKTIIPINTLAKIGKDAVFFDFNEKKVKISRFKPKNEIMLSTVPEIKVSILQKEPSSTIPIISNNFDENSFSNEKRIDGQQELKTNFEIAIPKKIITTKDGALGKICNKTIFGLNGEVIVKDRQIITEKIIEKAVMHGKLFELKNSAEWKTNYKSFN